MTEKAGKADEVTEYDEDFETLSKQMDQIKLMTERVLVHMESLLQPNPSIQSIFSFPSLVILNPLFRYSFGAVGQG